MSDDRPSYVLPMSPEQVEALRKDAYVQAWSHPDVCMAIAMAKVKLWDMLVVAKWRRFGVFWTGKP